MPMTPIERPRRRWLLYLAAFALTSGFRFLALSNGFPNDHFVYISGGWQMLFGEWPTRDWVDPGLPLMFAASAAAQAVFGPSLLAEALLVSAAFGVSAALTMAVVVETTGSLRLASAATLLEVIVFPRTYGYPKVLVYPLAFLCFARYVNKPGMSRAIAMVVSVVVAFLFRHDHGLFLGVAGALTILLSHRAGPFGERARHLFVFVVAGLVLVLPYLAFVQVNGGIGSYLRAGLTFSGREAQRQWHVWPAVLGDAEPFASALVYEFYLIPLVALVVLATLRRHAQFRSFVAYVVPVSCVAVMANYNFIRDPLNTRLPDAIVPALILGAWLVARAFESTRRIAVPAAVCAVCLFTASVAMAGDIVNNARRTDLAREWDHVPRLFAQRAASLQARFDEHQIPTTTTAALRPFFAYLDRCTTSEHRLLVGGFLVELPFFAQRRFAAGQGYFGGSFEGEEIQHQALRRLRGQVVPFTVMPSDDAMSFDATFPLVAKYVQSRYAPLTDIQINDESSVRILVDTALTPNGLDAETGWPCFLPR